MLKPLVIYIFLYLDIQTLHTKQTSRSSLVPSDTLASYCGQGEDPVAPRLHRFCFSVLVNKDELTFLSENHILTWVSTEGF